MTRDRGQVLRSLVATLLGLAVLLPPAPASANEAVDAATQAAQTNDEFCADLYSRSVEKSAESYPKVSEAWGRVSQVYDRSGEPYLLYWRGVLAQCLGQEELAIVDFQDFIDGQDGLGLFASLVRKAKSRLRRLGSRASAGQGASANWLRLRDRFEVRLSYRGGGGVRELSCVDDGGSGSRGRVENAACVGSLTRKDIRVPGIAPLGVEVGLDFFPIPKAAGIGMGARLLLDLPVPSFEYCGKSDNESGSGPYSCTPDRPAPGVDPNGHAPGPVSQVFIGPQIRVLSSVASGGRAGDLRIEPRFAMAFGQFAPWAGSPKDHEDFGFLDAGAYALRHFGGGVAVSGTVELGSKVVFSAGGEVALYAPAGASATLRIADPQPVLVQWSVDGDSSDVAPPVDVQVVEHIEILPEVWRSTRLYASGRVGILAPQEKANVAIGPFFQVAFHSTQVLYVDHVSNRWNAGEFEYLRNYRYPDLLGYPKLVNYFPVDQPARPDLVGKPGNPESEVLKHKWDRKVYSTRRQDAYFLFGIEVRIGGGAKGRSK